MINSDRTIITVVPNVGTDWRSDEAKKLVTLMLEAKIAAEKDDRIIEAQRNTEIDAMLSVDAPFTMLMRSVADRYRQAI